MYTDANGQVWYQGNLHTHTTRSDGHKTPEEVTALYRAAGYDFLALTDHWTYGAGYEQPGFVMLSGEEFNIGEYAETGVYHIVGIGMTDTGMASPGNHPERTQEVIDAIRDHGGMAILAHPAWSLNRVDAALALHGLDGVEIHNTVSGLPWNNRAYSGEFIDALAVAGCRPVPMAADDAHYYTGDETVARLYVRAEALTQAALMAALRRGDFFASCGPRMSITCKENRVLVDCTPAQHIVYHTNRSWAPHRVDAGQGITHGEYTFGADDRWMRVEVTDSQGRAAYSGWIYPENKQ